MRIPTLRCEISRSRVRVWNIEIQNMIPAWFRDVLRFWRCRSYLCEKQPAKLQWMETSESHTRMTFLAGLSVNDSSRHGNTYGVSDYGNKCSVEQDTELCEAAGCERVLVCLCFLKWNKHKTHCRLDFQNETSTNLWKGVKVAHLLRHLKSLHLVLVAKWNQTAAKAQKRFWIRNPQKYSGFRRNASLVGFENVMRWTWKWLTSSLDRFVPDPLLDRNTLSPIAPLAVPFDINAVSSSLMLSSRIAVSCQKSKQAQN